METGAPFPLTPSRADNIQPLSQIRNNVSVRCFVRDLKLLTVTDYWVQRGAEGRELNLETVWKLQIWREEIRLVTCGCWGQLFKMWHGVPAPRLLQQHPVISAKAVIQLHSPDWRGKKSGASHRKSSTTFCSQTVLRVFNHIARPFFFFSTCLIWAYGLEGLCNFRMFHVGKNYFINGKYCTSSLAGSFNTTGVRAALLLGKFGSRQIYTGFFIGCMVTLTRAQHTLFVLFVPSFWPQHATIEPTKEGPVKEHKKKIVIPQRCTWSWKEIWLTCLAGFYFVCVFSYVSCCCYSYFVFLTLIGAHLRPI